MLDEMSKNYSEKNISVFLGSVTPSQEFVPIFVVFSFRVSLFSFHSPAIELCRLQIDFKATEN
jgi:hypothetical protein